MEETTTGEPTSLQAPTDSEIEAVLDALGVSPQSNLISVLQEVQDRLGYLPPSALEQTSTLTKVRLSRIYGVVSFYAQFYTEPRGKHTVRCCRGTACHVRGGKRIIKTVEGLLGITDGETTDDMLFSFETVACLGACALSPVMVIDNTYYGKMTTRRAQSLVHRMMEEEGG